VHLSVARPRLAGDGVDDRAAVVDDVFGRRVTRFASAHGLGGDEPGALALLQAVVCAPEKVGDVVREPADLWVGAIESGDIARAALLRELLATEVRRVPDHDLARRPLDKQRVAADDVGIQVVERQHCTFGGALVSRSRHTRTSSAWRRMPAAVADMKR
jgi:hypothetical protein